MSRALVLLVALASALPLALLSPLAGAGATYSESGVHYEWNGTAGYGVRGEGTSQIYRFAVPANATSFAAFVNWTTRDTDLDLFVRDVNNTLRCSATHASGTSETCQGARRTTAGGPENWTLIVQSYQNLVGAGGPLREPFVAAVSLTYDDGIVTPPPTPGELLPPVPAGHARATFAPARVVDADRKTGEPGIDVASDGTVYVNAPYGPQSALWKSTDAGATFSYVPIHDSGGATTPASLATNQFPTGGGDSDFAVWGTQDLYFADLWGCNSVSASHDGGATWITNPLACDVPLTSDRQWLALDGPQHVYFGYNGFQGFVVDHSTDGGITWTHATIPQDNCFRGNIAVGPDHNVYAAGCNGEGVGVATSTDGGATFTWRIVDRTLHCPCNIFDVVTTDAAGNVYVVWSSADSGTLDVWMSSSSDHGTTWSAPHRVNGLRGAHVLPWPVGGAAGELDVVWYGTTEPSGDSAAVAGDWYAHFARTTNALDASPVFTESLVWDTPVQHGALCVSGTGCSGGRNLLDFFQVALDPTTGLAHVAFADGRAGGSASSTIIMQATQTS